MWRTRGRKYRKIGHVERRATDVHVIKTDFSYTVRGPGVSSITGYDDYFGRLFGEIYWRSYPYVGSFVGLRFRCYPLRSTFFT